MARHGVAVLPNISAVGSIDTGFGSDAGADTTLVESPLNPGGLNRDCRGEQKVRAMFCTPDPHHPRSGSDTGAVSVAGAGNNIYFCEFSLIRHRLVFPPNIRSHGPINAGFGSDTGAGGVVGIMVVVLFQCSLHIRLKTEPVRFGCGVLDRFIADWFYRLYFLKTAAWPNWMPFAYPVSVHRHSLPACGKAAYIIVPFLINERGGRLIVSME